MLTKAQKKRLAKEARGLAMECVAETAPNFGIGTEFEYGEPCCAMGHVAQRSGFRPEPDVETDTPLGEQLTMGGAEDDAWWLVARASDFNRDGLPWALLSFADDMEESARK